MNTVQSLQPLLRNVVCSSTPRAFANRALFVFGLVGSTTPLVTLCEKKKGDFLAKDSEGNIDWMATVNRLPTNEFWDDLGTAAGGRVQEAVDSGVPTALSYGFISGYCSGFALKKAGKAAASIFGLAFVSLQTLQYYGYVSVDHGKIKKDVENFLDLNDDGKVDKEDTKIAMQKSMELMQINMPSGGGFVAGFLGGLRTG